MEPAAPGAGVGITDVSQAMASFKMTSSFHRHPVDGVGITDTLSPSPPPNTII